MTLSRGAERCSDRIDEVVYTINAHRGLIEVLPDVIIGTIDDLGHRTETLGISIGELRVLVRHHSDLLEDLCR